jgi:23S rRNA (guanosine2251-2'-O)-methyltransferase
MKEWIVGRNPVYEVLRAGRREAYRLMVAEGVQEKGRLAEILRICKAKKISLQTASRRQLDSLGDGNQGVALETNGYSYSALPDMLETAFQRGEPPFLLILDTLQDPQNLGTLLRTAEIVGVHGVLLPFRRTATVTPAVVSASSGASEHLLIGQTNLAQAIDTLKEQDVWVAGLEGGESGRDLDQVRLDGALALVVGNEAEGMRPLVRESCDVLVRIPMRGQIDSLNAAVAGSVALYFTWQARGFSGKSSPELRSHR